MSRGELVTNLRNSDRSHFDLCEGLAFFVHREDHAVDLSIL